MTVSGWVGARLADRNIKWRATGTYHHLIGSTLRSHDLVDMLMTTKISGPVRLNHVPKPVTRGWVHIKAALHDGSSS
jgi:hypothetical protein